MPVRRRRVVSEEPKRELTNIVEIYEVKQFKIKAKNMLDAKQALNLLLQSQDNIQKIESHSWGYLATCEIFQMRDF